MLFVDRQKHSGVRLVKREAVLARLALIRHGDAYEQEHQGVDNGSDDQPPFIGHDKDRAEGDAPPKGDLAQVVGVSGIFPNAFSNKARAAVMPELVLGAIGKSLDKDGAQRKYEEYDAPYVELGLNFVRKYYGQHTSKDH